MYIEANKANYLDKNSGEKVTITGNVGKVMSESCSIAISFAKTYLSNVLNIRRYNQIYALDV